MYLVIGTLLRVCYKIINNIVSYILVVILIALMDLLYADAPSVKKRSYYLTGSKF